MLAFGAVTRTVVATIDVDEAKVRVTLHVSHDGVEYIGRLWFAEYVWDESGIPDRALLPGRTEAEVVALARRLRPDELLQRYRRAHAEKRRFHGLRQLTLEMLSKIRYMNKVAVSMRSGMLDSDAARQEIELTEVQLIELVKQAKVLAGVES